MTNAPFAAIVRGYVSGLASAPASAFSPVQARADLPLIARHEGGVWARRVFRSRANPHDEATGAAVAIASAPVDALRFFITFEDVDVAVYEGANFFLLLLPASAGAMMETALLRLDAPPVYGEPDDAGWRSTAPDLDLDGMSDWRDRIDRLDGPGGRLVLVFKSHASATAFEPTPFWF